MRFFILLIAISSLGFLSACAALHHVQLGEIDNRSGAELVPIEFMVSEYGIDLNDAKSTSKILLNSKDSKQANDVMTFLQYFQMGPTTGAPVFVANYADHLEAKLKQQCPSGRITGIMGIRESREYPVIKGEIVKVKAFCLRYKEEKI